MASRDVMDNRIDAWKDQYKDNQTPWRQTSSDTGNYGQVLRGNVKPSDQRLDGPPLPVNLKDEGDVNVYEQPDSAPGGAGFGWEAAFDASENPGPVLYTRTVGVFEDSGIVETPWVEVDETVP